MRHASLVAMNRLNGPCLSPRLLPFSPPPSLAATPSLQKVLWALVVSSVSAGINRRKKNYWQSVTIFGSPFLFSGIKSPNHRAEVRDTVSPGSRLFLIWWEKIKFEGRNAQTQKRSRPELTFWAWRCCEKCGQEENTIPYPVSDSSTRKTGVQ